MAGITHSVAATGVDSGDGKVSVNAWNAEHVVPDGALAQAAVAGLVAALAAKQAAADILAALAALDGTVGILRVTGAGTVERLTDTVAGRALLTAADAAAQRLALGLGTAATTDATAYATAAHNHAGVYSPVGHGHAAAGVTGLAAVATSGSASDLGAGTLPAARIASGALPLAKLADGTALSVLGRSANSDGAYADIVAASDGGVLRRSGTAVGFGSIPNASVTGLGTAALVDTGTSAANVPTIAQADARYAPIAGGSMTIGLTAALAAGVVPY